VIVDRLEVLIKAFLCRLVVVRHDNAAPHPRQGARPVA
jgi:hypothetical protein